MTPSPDLGSLYAIAKLFSWFLKAELFGVGNIVLKWLNDFSDYPKEMNGGLNYFQLITEHTRPDLKDGSWFTLTELCFFSQG